MYPIWFLDCSQFGRRYQVRSRERAIQVSAQALSVSVLVWIESLFRYFRFLDEQLGTLRRFGAHLCVPAPSLVVCPDNLSPRKAGE